MRDIFSPWVLRHVEASSFQTTLCPILFFLLSHSHPVLLQYKQRNTERGNDKEKRRIEPNNEKGKGDGYRRLTTSDQNSEADQVDMKFASNKSPPSQALLCLNSLYPWGSYHLSLFLMPASSFHTSSNHSRISLFPSRPWVALCFALFASYTPLSHSALACLFCSPAPPSQRPFASSLSAADERRNKWRSAC